MSIAFWQINAAYIKAVSIKVNPEINSAANRADIPVQAIRSAGVNAA
ncbi:MAG: hypothetical protein HKM93_22555 [Desulfobacteraceae bacterium]|nr:hypothetical protein [Desulfobacteraceae bacterium]